MTTYRASDLRQKFLGTFRNDAFAVFNYPPQRWEKYNGHNDTTDLIIAFKEADPDAITIAARWAIKAVSPHEATFRDELECRYLVAAPKHSAGVVNEGAEELCRRLASKFPWLSHLDRALVRTVDVPKSAGAKSRPSAEDHAASISFVAGALGAEPIQSGKLYCPTCAKRFKSQSGFDYHNGWAHGGQRALGGGFTGTFLVLDDIVTHGATYEGCRRVIEDAAGCPSFGLFLGKTGGW